MSLSDRPHAGIRRALCIMDPCLTGVGGHSLAYDLALAEAAAPAFDLVEIFADRTFGATNAQAYAASGARAAHVHARLGRLRLHSLKTRLRPLGERLHPSRPLQPVPLSFRFVADDPQPQLNPALYIVKRLRALDLAWSLHRLLRVRYARVRDIHIFFQNAGLEELLCLDVLHGFLDAETHAARARTLTLHLLFRHVPARSCARAIGIAGLAGMLRRQSALPYVRMYTDTEELSAAFRSLVQTPGQFQTLPVPPLLGSAPVCRDAPIPGQEDGTFRLGMPGPPRMEKGFGCLPALLDVLPAQVAGRRLELVVQTDVEETDSAIRAVTGMLREYAARAGEDSLRLRLLSGPLAPAAYAACFAGLDCALLLHSSPKYAASSSGIFVEALHRGIPSIAFAGSWMGTMITAARDEGLKIGLTVDTLGDVPAALARIAAEHGVFADHSAAYRARHAGRFDLEASAAAIFAGSPGGRKTKDGAAAC